MDPAEPPRLEEGGAARAGSEPPPEEADPRGFHELAFLGHSNASEAEPELEERDVGPEFDSYEDLDGDKLRLLDSFSIYYEDGRLAPPRALDSAKERGQTFVAFGTLVAPLTTDASLKLISLDARLKCRVPPCLPKSLVGGGPEPLPWVAAAGGASATPSTPKGGGGTSGRGGKGGASSGGGKKQHPKARQKATPPPPPA
ncbi:unnamed protein product, partial [Ectocarpus sp. 8 AP-2014]